jgi:nitrite reductase/ring-hydroxylating ferredoxin subunit
MNSRASSFFLLIAFMLLSACNAEPEYSTWPCRFAYDNGVHQDATLASVMEVNAPGMFCLITESVRGGVKYLNFKTNHNDVSSLAETEAEKRAEYILGLNNGIIVGFQNAVLDAFGNATFVAYDVQCPNCVRQYNNTLSPTYGVVMDDKGMATCSKCGRRYDMNSGGVLQNGQQGDTGLEKYAAATSGPYGHLSVFRHR